MTRSIGLRGNVHGVGRWLQWPPLFPAWVRCARHATRGSTGPATNAVFAVSERRRRCLSPTSAMSAGDATRRTLIRNTSAVSAGESREQRPSYPAAGRCASGAIERTSSPAKGASIVAAAGLCASGWAGGSRIGPFAMLARPGGEDCPQGRPRLKVVLCCECVSTVYYQCHTREDPQPMQEILRRRTGSSSSG